MLAVRFGTVYQAQKVGDELDLYFAKLKGVFIVDLGLGGSFLINQNHQIDVDYSLEWGVNMGAFRHIAGLSYKYLFPNSAFAYREDTRKELEFEELLKQRAQTITNTQQDSGNITNKESTKVKPTK